MRKSFKIYYFFALIFASNTDVICQTTKIMTYNIRYDNPNDGVNNWDNRKEDVLAIIKKYQPKILGLQEGLHHQIKYLDSCLASYKFIGVGREDGKLKGEFSPIFYDTTKFSVLETSTFWLSEQSDTISVGWDAVLERICTYGLFEHNDSKQRFWVFNTHFDHIGVKAREMSAKLILNKIKSLNKNDLPVVFMGDLNSEPNSKPIEIISEKLTDGIVNSKNPFKGSIATFTGFNLNEGANKRLDYIFVKSLNVSSYAHIEDRMKNNNYISDHLPVLMSVSFSN